MHYCIGDVHGCYEELMKLLRIIEGEDAEAEFILLGDLIDRGEDSEKVLGWALQNVSPDGKYQCICGNHEDLVLQWYDYKFLPWYRNVPGPEELMPRSKFDFTKIADKKGWNTPEKLNPVINMMRSMPLRKQVTVTDPNGNEKHYVIVHASYDKKFGEGILQNKANLRLRKFTGNPDTAYTVVFGHTPTGDAEFVKQTGLYDSAGRIAHLNGAVNIDGGCCFGTRDGYQGNLCAICLETEKEFYVKKNRE